jgi:hypothetical protein
MELINSTTGEIFEFKENECLSDGYLFNLITDNKIITIEECFSVFKEYFLKKRKRTQTEKERISLANKKKYLNKKESN